MVDNFFGNLQARLHARSHTVEGVEVVVDPDQWPACVKWTGAVSKSGYGTIHLTPPCGRKIHTTAHRAAYMLSNKLVQIPHFDSRGRRLEISHLCHEKLCINIKHLTLEISKLYREREICCTNRVCLGHKPECIFEVRNISKSRSN